MPPKKKAAGKTCMLMNFNEHKMHSLTFTGVEVSPTTGEVIHAAPREIVLLSG